MTGDSMSQALGDQAYVYVAPIETYHEVAMQIISKLGETSSRQFMVGVD